jgi:hypothetical protein
VKIVRVGDHFLCQLGRDERTLLWDLLNLYPCISSAAQPGLPGSGNSTNQLLEEALAEQRAENKKRVQIFLRDRYRFQHSDKDLRLSLSNAELEWLLQILNDVRIGNWILLGSPDEKFELKMLDEKTAPHFWAMEMAGHFEMQILSALKD